MSFMDSNISDNDIRYYTRCFPSLHVNTMGYWVDKQPLNYAVDLLLMELPIISIVTCALYALLRPLGHPSIISQILGGLVLGPSVLGHNTSFRRAVFPMKGKVILETFSLFGFIFFQFLIGVRMDPNIIFESGKKVVVIGIFGYFFPVIIGGFVCVFLRTFTHVDDSILKVLNIIVGTESMSAYPVIACFLGDLKILNSELGRLASSSSIISDVCSILTILFFKFNVLLSREHAVANAVGSFVSGFVMLVFILIFVRPIALWVVRQTPEGKPVKEAYVFGFIILVLGCSFISQMTGQGYIIAPFVLGLVIPDGPPLGSALEERLDAFVSTLLMPIYFTLCGLKADIFTLGKGVWVLHVLVLTCFLSKIIGIVLPNIYYRMPVRDAFILALMMNSKGVVELALYNAWMEDQILTKEVFTVMVISLLFITILVTHLVRSLYNPARRYLPYRRRTVQHAKRNTELSILTCVHNQDNVPTLIQLLDISNPSKENPIRVCVLHLVELVGRASSLLITHKKHGKSSSKPTNSEHIIRAFRYYEQNRQSGVWVDVFTSISPCVTMHDDVCALALEKRVSLIILPFHKQWVAEGAADSSTSIRNMNCNVLEKAPCSVGILISHSYLSASQTLLPRKQMYSILLFFIGGADDREALCYAERMVEHPNVTLTLVRFISKFDSYDGDEKMKILDNDVLQQFRDQTMQNDRVACKEELVKDGTDLFSVIRSIEKGYDLVIVGRRHVESPLTSGLIEWVEHPELGVLGDILAAPDFKIVPTILVVQQQARVWGMPNPEYTP